MPVRAADARAWVRGQRPLRQADEVVFFPQTPPAEADWFPFVPGPWRFENRRDFEATKEKWEREILRRGALPPPGREPQGEESGAMDIRVQRHGRPEGEDAG
jgi:hypothetical protein